MDYLFFEKNIYLQKKKKTKMNRVVSQQYLGNWSSIDNNKADRKMGIVPASEPTKPRGGSWRDMEPTEVPTATSLTLPLMITWRN